MCSDNTFVSYIKSKQDAYDKGNIMDPEVLINIFNNKYQTLVQGNKWGGRDKEPPFQTILWQNVQNHVCVIIVVLILVIDMGFCHYLLVEDNIC